MPLWVGHIERSPSDRTEVTPRVGAERGFSRFSKVAGSSCPMPEQVLVTGILSLCRELPFRLQDIPTENENGWRAEHNTNIRFNRRTDMPSNYPKRSGRV